MARGFSNTPSHLINNDTINNTEKYPYCLQIDWLTIVYDFCDFNTGLFTQNSEVIYYLDELVNILLPGFKFSDFEGENSSKWGYKKRIVISEDCTIYFLGAEMSNGNKSMCLDITGNGMKYISDKQLYDLFVFSNNLNHLGKITRMDPGFDNHTSICKLWDLKNKCDLGHYKCRSKCSIYYSTKNEDESLTIYFGKGSPFMTRFYDKNAERRAKDCNFIQTHEYWTRYEIQCRDDSRNSAFAGLFVIAYERGNMNEFAKYVAEVLNGFVKFYRDKNCDHIWDQWKRLLLGASGIKIRTTAKASSLLDTKIDWFNRSCMSTTSLIFAAFDDSNLFEKWLMRGIGLNLVNCDSAKRAIINKKRVELGLLPFEQEDLKRIGMNLVNKYDDLEGVLQAFMHKEWCEIEHEVLLKQEEKRKEGELKELFGGLVKYE